MPGQILPDIQGPLYLKLVTHIEKLIEAGELQPGEKLPSSRDFARRLGVSRNTVVNAFEELQARGVLTSHTGSGTFVARTSQGSGNLASQRKRARPISLEIWQSKFSKRMEAFRDASQNRFYGSVPREGVVSFSRAVPPREFFPVEEFRRVMSDVLRSAGAKALQYAPPGGTPSLKRYLAKRFSLAGTSVSEEEILITNGSQQGIDLVAKVFLDPGDTIVIESPVYSGAIALYGLYQVRQIPVEVAEDGMRVELLRELLPRYRPKFVHTTPTFQNPTGSTMPLARRRELLEIAFDHHVPIVEDDFVGELRFEGTVLPSLKALDTKGAVLQLGTFSKVCFPGLRIGWVVAEESLIQRMRVVKQFSDLGASALLQEAIAEFCERGLLDKHLKRMKKIYASRRDVMLEALEAKLPSEVSWYKPEGGMSVWVMLPPSLDVTELLVESRRAGVDFAAGPIFYPGSDGQPAMRLNYSCLSESEIEAGVERLGRVFDRMLGRMAGERKMSEDGGPLPVV